MDSRGNHSAWARLGRALLQGCSCRLLEASFLWLLCLCALIHHLQYWPNWSLAFRTLPPPPHIHLTHSYLCYFSTIQTWLWTFLLKALPQLPVVQ